MSSIAIQFLGSSGGRASADKHALNFFVRRVEKVVDIENDYLRGRDSAIRPLLRTLHLQGIETDWSCEGSPGHMVIRPTIQCRTTRRHAAELMQERDVIQDVMSQHGIANYWLSLNFAHGDVDTHGGEPVWLIQIPGRFDFLALPVAPSLEYIDGDDDIVNSYEPLTLSDV